MKNYKKWCKMIKFIFNEFEKISKKNKGKINLINIWDTEFKLEKKFKVTINEANIDKFSNIKSIFNFLSKKGKLSQLN